MMNEQTKLILALMQIENLISLLQQNPYQQYLHSRLIQMQVEINRQLTNTNLYTKIKE
jgi:hypothetical protein